MQTSGDFGRVAPLVLFEQPVKNLLPDDRPDGIAGPLPSVMEPVVKPAGLAQEVVPAVGTDDLLVDRAVNLAKFDDVPVRTSLVVDKVVRGRQAATHENNLTTVVYQSIPNAP